MSKIQINKSNEFIKCISCDKLSTSFAFCNTCKGFLCQSCLNLIEKGIKIFKSHFFEIFPQNLNSISTITTNDFKLCSTCEEKKQLDYFCENCGGNICYECFEHHKTIPILSEHKPKIIGKCLACKQNKQLEQTICETCGGNICYECIEHHKTPVLRKHIIKLENENKNEQLQKNEQQIEKNERLQNISNEQENLINVPIREKSIKKESSLLKSKSLQNNNSNKFVL